MRNTRRRLRLISFIPLGMVVASCGARGPAETTNIDEPAINAGAQETPMPIEASPAPQAPSFAGRWREEDGQELEFAEGGQIVTPSPYVKGTWHATAGVGNFVVDMVQEGYLHRKMSGCVSGDTMFLKVDGTTNQSHLSRVHSDNSASSPDTSLKCS